jgi:hypothetical protein
MDGFGWFAIDRLRELCTPRMAAVLTRRSTAAGVVEALRAGGRRASPPEAVARA